MSQTTITYGKEKQQVKIDLLRTKKAALVLRAINHKLRQQILKYIDDKEVTAVTEIYVKLKIEQSVASQHLAILRRAGLVTTRRDGKFIYYTVNYTGLQEMVQYTDQLLGS